MKIAIHRKHVRITAVDRQRINDQIRLALTRFAPLISRLTATISDENGPRGGVDKRCRLVVPLHAGTVVVNEQASSVMAAVTLAVERAARSIARVHHRAVDARQTVPSARRGRRIEPEAAG